MSSPSRTYKNVSVFFCIKYLLFVGNIDNSRAVSDLDMGEPLCLTPLLEMGKVVEAQEKSKVHLEIGNMTSYSGYFTVNKECESNLFFWYFPAQSHSKNAPLLLWLIGGPGSSSVFSLFMELGPLTYKGEVGHREYSWNVENNLLFIDQPVGSGFSFTKKQCYAKNDTEVGKELYSAVVQFYQLFPELVHNPFFVSGYSYGGHYVPSLALEIHRHNPTAETKIKLSGMTIGNGLVDPVFQFDLGNFLYQIGVIDEAEKEASDKSYQTFVNYIKHQEWEMALKEMNVMWPNLQKRYGNVSEYNFLNASKDYIYGSQPYEDFVKSPKTRKAIHVGNASFAFHNPTVAEHLGASVVFSMRSEIEELLEHYPLVFYVGQLDILCAYPMIERFLLDLNWSGSAGYRNATRHKWCVDGAQAGYYKSAHNLHEVMVRSAGHSVPHDQPHWAYVLANSVTSGSPDDPLHGLDKC